MPTYVTRIRKDSGETVEQLISVPAEDQLSQALSRVDGFVMSWAPYSAPSSPAPATTAPGATRRSTSPDARLRSRPSEIVTFSWYLYTLLHAGVPLARGLHVLRSQLPTPQWHHVLGTLIHSLESGETFADSLQRFPRFFPSHFAHLVEVGELAGNLDTVLLELATTFEKQLENRARLRGALAYPCFLLGACGLVVVFLIAFVLPRIARMFTNMSVEMPWITRFLLALSDALRTYYPAVLVLSAAALIGVVAAHRLPGGRRVLAHGILRAPLLGPFMQRVLLARFCQTLALLQRSGVSLLVSLALARQGLGNVVLEEFMLEVERNLREGAPLGVELARSPFVPEMVSSMVSVGEETGRLPEMLSNVTRFYERDMDHLVRTLPKVIEPAIIVVMTGVVGMLAASIFIPLAQLTQGIR